MAFVFSAPGTKENGKGRPVAGATGENLEFALAHLCQKEPKYFPSSDRYAYRITNAFQSALSIGLGSGRTEASSAEILKPTNVSRVVEELKVVVSSFFAETRHSFFRPPLGTQASGLSASHIRATRLCHPSTTLHSRNAARLHLIEGACAQRRGRLASKEALLPTVRPNPSIERTCPGKLGHASHLKR